MTIKMKALHRYSKVVILIGRIITKLGMAILDHATRQVRKVNDALQVELDRLKMEVTE